MSNKNDLNELEQKTYNEFLIDGIIEVFAGLILLFFPIFYFIRASIVFVFFWIFLSPRVIDYVRQRTTYPRIGRVEFKEVKLDGDYSIKKSIRDLLLLFVVAILLTCIFMIIFEGRILEISLWYSWVPFIFGLIMFGPSLFLVEKTGQRYYYIFGLFSSLLGLGISLIDFPDILDGMFFYFFTLGILALILGILKYLWFIRNYPVIDLEED